MSESRALELVYTVDGAIVDREPVADILSDLDAAAQRLARRVGFGLHFALAERHATADAGPVSDRPLPD